MRLQCAFGRDREGTVWPVPLRLNNRARTRSARRTSEGARPSRWMRVDRADPVNRGHPETPPLPPDDNADPLGLGVLVGDPLTL